MRTFPWEGGTVYATDDDPRCVLVYMASAEREDAEALFHALEGDTPFALALYGVADWNTLSPWAADRFPGGGQATLRRLEAALAALPEDYAALPCYIGGYSLAGLFALWATHESRRFSGCAAVSGSFWYPGLVDYVRSAPLPPEAKIYLSLGKKEHKSRNALMRTVNECLNALYDHYATRCHCILEWNEGNHFTEPMERMRKGFGCLMASEE